MELTIISLELFNLYFYLIIKYITIKRKLKIINQFDTFFFVCLNATLNQTKNITNQTCVKCGYNNTNNEADCYVS